MDDCVFCKIIRGQLPASIVYEDKWVLAFMDLVPINPGHTLVIPKEHYAYLAEMPQEIGGEIFKIGMRVEQAIRAGEIPCEGTNLYLANGETAGQEVFHLHLHVIPRLVGDGSGFRFNSKNRAQPERQELDRIARNISAGM